MSAGCADTSELSYNVIQQPRRIQLSKSVHELVQASVASMNERIGGR